MAFDHQWRVVDTEKLSGERRADFERDRRESNRRYDHAFQVVLSHTSSMELQEFWRLFMITPSTSINIELGAGASLSDADMHGDARQVISLDGGIAQVMGIRRTRSQFEASNPMYVS